MVLHPCISALTMYAFLLSTVRGAPKAVCSEEDQARWNINQTVNDAFWDFSVTCATEYPFEMKEKLIPCFEQELSSSCSRCYAGYVYCGFQHCSADCLLSTNFNSDYCWNCVAQNNCMVDLAKCANLSVDKMMHRKTIPVPPTTPKPELKSCVASSQRKIITAEKFTNDLITCGRRSLGDVDGTTSCLMKMDPGLTKACGLCFGYNVLCGSLHCAGQCLVDPYSDACAKCGAVNCLVSLYECSGASGPDDLPRSPNGKTYTTAPPGTLTTTPQPHSGGSEGGDRPSTDNCYRSSAENVKALDVFLGFVDESRVNFYLYFNLPVFDVKLPKAFKCQDVKYGYDTATKTLYFDGAEDPCAEGLIKWFNEQLTKAAGKGKPQLIPTKLPLKYYPDGNKVTLNIITSIDLMFTDKCSGNGQPFPVHKAPLPPPPSPYQLDSRPLDANKGVDAALLPRGTFVIDQFPAIRMGWRPVSPFVADFFMYFNSGLFDKQVAPVSFLCDKQPYVFDKKALTVTFYRDAECVNNVAIWLKSTADQSAVTVSVIGSFYFTYEQAAQQFDFTLAKSTIYTLDKDDYAIWPAHTVFSSTTPPSPPIATMRASTTPSTAWSSMWRIQNIIPTLSLVLLSLSCM